MHLHLWCRVGLAARIGSDFPAACQKWLEAMEVDVSGLLLWPYPTLRAWQVGQDFTFPKLGVGFLRLLGVFKLHATLAVMVP